MNDESKGRKKRLNRASIETPSDNLRTPKLSIRKRRRRSSVPSSLLVQTPNRVNFIRRRPNSSVSSAAEIISDRVFDSGAGEPCNAVSPSKQKKRKRMGDEEISMEEGEVQASKCAKSEEPSMAALMEMVKGIGENLTASHGSITAKLDNTNVKLENVMTEVSGIKLASEMMGKRVTQNEMDIIKVQNSLHEIDMKMKSSHYVDRLREDLSRTQKNVVIYNYTPPDNSLGLSRLDHINKLAPNPSLTDKDIEVLGKEEVGKKIPPILVKLDSFDARNKFLSGLKDKKQWLKGQMSINVDLPQVYRATHKKFRAKGKWHRDFTKPEESTFRVTFVDIEMRLVFQRKGYDPTVLDTFTPSEDNRSGRITQSALGPTPAPSSSDIEVYRRTLILTGVGKGVDGHALKREVLSITGVKEGDFVLTFTVGVDSAKIICNSFDVLQIMEQKLKGEKNRKCFRGFQLY